MKKETKVVVYRNAYTEVMIEFDKKSKELAEQKELDLQKWLESEYKNYDMSGLMDYCVFCPHRSEHHECTCTSEDRLENRRCVKAYHKFKEIVQD